MLSFPNHQAIHHQFDGMLLILFRLDLLTQIIENAVHSYTGKAGFSGIFKHFSVFTLFATDNG